MTKQLLNRVCPGKVDIYPSPKPVFIDIEFDPDNGRLSITGVEGPKANGDAWGSCGQCSDSLANLTAVLDPGWTPEMVARLAEIWDRWHLNDMRAGCEHQRLAGWDKRPIDPSKPTNTYGKHFDGQQYDTWNLLMWIRPDEHPDGLLTKPCEQCGYRFGSSWLHEPVPDDVIEFLTNLPRTERKYPDAWAH